MWIHLECPVRRAVTELEEQLQQLKGSGSELSARLRGVAAALVNPGVCPDEDLQDVVSSYREQWDNLSSAMQMTEKNLSTENGSIWEKFERRLADLRKADETLALLEPVEQICVPAGSESLLAPAHQLFHDVVSRLQKSPWSEATLIEDVRAGRHPLCRLVSLVGSLQELTDDQWAVEMNAMQQAFGVALSTALARGKLSLSPAPRVVG